MLLAGFGLATVLPSSSRVYVGPEPVDAAWGTAEDVCVRPLIPPFQTINLF